MFDTHFRALIVNRIILTNKPNWYNVGSVIFLCNEIEISKI